MQLCNLAQNRKWCKNEFDLESDDYLLTIILERFLTNHSLHLEIKLQFVIEDKTDF